MALASARRILLEGCQCVKEGVNFDSCLKRFVDSCNKAKSVVKAQRTTKGSDSKRLTTIASSY